MWHHCGASKTPEWVEMITVLFIFKQHIIRMLIRLVTHSFIHTSVPSWSHWFLSSLPGFYRLMRAWFLWMNIIIRGLFYRSRRHCCLTWISIKYWFAYYQADLNAKWCLLSATVTRNVAFGSFFINIVYNQRGILLYLFFMWTWLPQLLSTKTQIWPKCCIIKSSESDHSTRKK